jgi:putative glutamine amidotransferase
VSALVAVTAPQRAVDGRPRVALNTTYVQSLLGVGLVPVIVPPLLDPQQAAVVLDAVGGLMLTGGEDVVPARFGAAPHPALGRTDAKRDAVEVALIEAARERRMPILAICRGIQIVNVAMGGSLYQDLPSERPGPIDHHDEAARHPVAVEPGTLLARVVGARPAPVISRHHQAVRDLAPGLRVSASAPDGVIECVEPANGGPWMLAVQWHPEDDVEEALFRGFAEAVR